MHQPPSSPSEHKICKYIKFDKDSPSLKHANKISPKKIKETKSNKLKILPVQTCLLS